MSSPPPPLHHGTPASSAEPSLERAIGPVALILGPSAALVLLYLALQATAQGVLGPELAADRLGAPRALLASTGAFRPLAVLGSMSLLLVYLAVCLAALRLRRMRPRAPGTFRVPGGPVVPLLAAATVVWVLSHSTHAEVAATALLLGAGTLYYLARGRIGVRAPAP